MTEHRSVSGQFQQSDQSVQAHALADPNGKIDVERQYIQDGIWRLTIALADAVTPLEVAQALAEEGAAAVGASFSNMGILSPAVNRVHAVHRSDIEPGLAGRWSDFDLDASTPLGDAMLTGLPVLLESADATRERYPHMLGDTLAASLSATASLPLPSGSGDMLGAAGFGWPTPQAFGLDQLRCLDLIAHMAARALEHTLGRHLEHGGPSSLRADAQLFQDAFLPRVLPHTDTLEIAAIYLPAKHAAMGGDWYDVFPVEGGICLVIGDVTGHGLAAAAVMGQLRNTVRAYAIEDPSPARVLTRLNHLMYRLEPGHYASAIVAVWDEERGTLLRSNAGHPPLLRCRPGEFGYLFASQGDRLLGATPNWIYHEEAKILRPGTTLLFYTDGLIEWRTQTLDGGMDALLALTKTIHDLSPQVVCDQAIQWRRRMARQEDDVCLLAVRLR
jgi:serine phosphatase RsbU (regulator of sigma subunit)